MTAEKLKLITEKTAVPLSLAAGAVAVLIPLLLWGAKLDARMSFAQDANARDHEAYSAMMEKCNASLTEINTRLSRIEGAVGVSGRHRTWTR